MQANIHSIKENDHSGYYRIVHNLK